MQTTDAFRDTRIPLAHGGAIPAFGFGTLIADRAAAKGASHPYLPEWDMLEYCRAHGIVLQAFAPLGHAMQPRVIDDPVIRSIAQRTGKTPAQVALAWAVQRGGAVLTTSTNPGRIRENVEVAPLSEDDMRQMREAIGTSVRFNAVVATGVPGFVPRSE